MKGWVVYNGNLGDKFLQHADIFQECAKRQNVELEVVKNNNLVSAVIDGSAALLRDVTNEQFPDFVLFWDKDIYLARQLEMLGLRLFNRAHVIENCDDKAFTYQILSNKGIRMPKTMVAPKIFQWSGIKEFDYYERVMDELGFPIVIKETHGSFGSQVYLVSDKAQLIAKIADLGNIPYVFQQFISSSHGRDLRLQVVGGEVVAAMRRVSNGDFRANVGKGAKPYAHTPTKEQADLAVKCASVLGADFAGVDLMFGPDEEPILCEVNSNAHIINLMNCTGINAAEFMIAHIKAEIYED